MLKSAEVRAGMRIAQYAPMAELAPTFRSFTVKSVESENIVDPDLNVTIGTVYTITDQNGRKCTYMPYCNFHDFSDYSYLWNN